MVALRWGTLHCVECDSRIVGHAAGWRAYLAKDPRAGLSPLGRLLDFPARVLPDPGAAHEGPDGSSAVDVEGVVVRFPKKADAEIKARIIGQRRRLPVSVRGLTACLRSNDQPGRSHPVSAAIWALVKSLALRSAANRRSAEARLA